MRCKIIAAKTERFKVNKKTERFKVNHARTSRYQNSTIIQMQKLLNSDYEERRKISKKIDSVCSREERLQYSSLSLRYLKQ